MDDMTIQDVLEAHGDFAHGGAAESVAEDWEMYDFTPAEVEEWLKARCFEPGAADSLKLAGVSPEQARTETEIGIGGYMETIGYKFSNNDLTLGQVCEILGIE